jgi:hypothetical protein
MLAQPRCDAPLPIARKQPTQFVPRPALQDSLDDDVGETFVVHLAKLVFREQPGRGFREGSTRHE